MKKGFEGVESQVVRQREGRTKVRVSFLDAKPETVNIINKGFGYFIQPLFKKAKHLDAHLFIELRSQFEMVEDESMINVINSGLAYNYFFQRYYNNLEVSDG